MALPCLISSEVVLAAVQENSQILNSVDEAGGSGGIGGGGDCLSAPTSAMCFRLAGLSA